MGSKPLHTVVVSPGGTAKAQPPPKWVFAPYMRLVASRFRRQAGDRPVSLDDVGAIAGSPGAGRQLVHQWVRHRMAVRTRRGSCCLVDPSVAVRVWGVDAYYADLLVLHDVLEGLEEPHAFLCLAAGLLTDLVPGEVWPVRPPRDDDAVAEVDAFRFELGPLAHVRLDVLGLAVNVPVPNPADAALLLAATGLPRHVSAARQVLARITVHPKLARRLNHYGIETLAEVYESEHPGIQLPKALEERRNAHARRLLEDRTA